MPGSLRGGSMSSHRLPLAVFVFFFSALMLAQTRGGGGSRGGGGGSYVDPATNARNAAVLGTGNSDLTIVRHASASDEPKVEFRSESILIQVPVVVADKSGNHIHGLDKESFTILEGGKEQK